MKRDLNQHGFTLAEIVIVIVFTGLMVGAVLKGQAMINDAKQKKLMSDLQGISAAYFIYLDRYNAVPGDDPEGDRWEGVAVGNGSGFIGGNVMNPDGESQEAWQALRFAGLLSGDPTATGESSLPPHPYSGIYGIGEFTFAGGIGTKNRILINKIPADVAENIDIKFDDGHNNTGTVQSSGSYSGGTLVNLNFAL